MLCCEFICEELDDGGPVSDLGGENDGEELEAGCVRGIDGQGDPLGGDTAAESEGRLLGIGEGRAGLEKIRLLDGGEDVEVGERSEHEHADNALYR